MATTKKTTEQSTAAEIAAEGKTPIKPANSPSLKPWAALNRRQRAEFQKTWAANLPNEALSDLGSDGDLDLSKVGFGFAFSFLADVEDALALVAVAPDLFREWAGDVSDDELQALFTWYQETQASGK